MHKIYNAIIVGGGATGLLCAVELCRGNNALDGQDVLIIERNERVGKKILATGNGQGNISNENMSLDNYHGDDNFIQSFFQNSNNLTIESYFENLGLPILTEANGKKFPLSKQSSSISDIIRAHINEYNIQSVFSEKVISVAKYKGYYRVTTTSQEFYAKNVVLACGGKAGKQFGTDGSSYVLAQKFGHKLSQLYPSLVQLKTDTSLIRGLNGLKENVIVSAYDGEKFLKTAKGDILFTQYGVSGSAIFQVSGYLTSAKNPNIKIEFLPQYTYEETLEVLELVKNSPLYKTNPLLGIINKKVGEALVKSCVNRTTKDFARAIKGFYLKVTGNLGFDLAQVTKGGILTDNICPNTLESQLEKGIYLGGEMLNVDGDCGGYNLTFAFMCGIKIAKAIKNKNHL